MRCPFQFKAPKRKFSFGVAGEFVDFCDERDQAAEEAYYREYPTCKDRFWKWVHDEGFDERPMQIVSLIALALLIGIPLVIWKLS